MDVLAERLLTVNSTSRVVDIDYDDEQYSGIEKPLAILPKVTSLVSILGSALIIRKVMANMRKNKHTTSHHHRHTNTAVYDRLVLGMSVADVASSCALFLSTWPMPEATHAHVYAARGTVATCTAQGFVAQAAALMIPSYNTMLSIYYLLVVTHNWPASRVTALEPYLHTWPWLLGLGTAIAGLFMDLYNPVGFQCWIGPEPAGCDTNDDQQCQRGALSYIFRWVFFYGWIWFYFVVNTILMIRVYYSVLQQERRTDKYRTAVGLQVERHRSQSVGYQGILYVLAYDFTYIWGTVIRIQQQRDQPVSDALFLCFAFCYPLQGLLNALIYLGVPRFNKWRAKKAREQQQQQIGGEQQEQSSSCCSRVVGRWTMHCNTTETQPEPVTDSLAATQESPATVAVVSMEEPTKEQSMPVTQDDMSRRDQEPRKVPLESPNMLREEERQAV